MPAMDAGELRRAEKRRTMTLHLASPHSRLRQVIGAFGGRGLAMRWLSVVALAVGLIAVGISTWTWQQADARAEAALQRREKALVVKHRPAVVKMCREFGVKEPPADAETLDELMAPVERLLTGLSK